MRWGQCRGEEVVQEARGTSSSPTTLPSHLSDCVQKEERIHDDKIASANQRIKQAGQIYERKVKKNPRDAADEHTRYMNLLSTLGPEVNKEK